MLTAIIDLQGHQYLVKEGDRLLVDFLRGQEPEAKIIAIYRDDTLLDSRENKKYQVVLEVEKAEVKGKKLKILVYKAKSRYRRHRGFRPRQSVIKVTKIQLRHVKK